MTWLLAILVAGVALAAAIWWRQPTFHASPALLTGTLLEPRRELPDFTLIDQQGRDFAPANLRGAWSFLYFGYTNCPDACPATLSTLAALEKHLRAAGNKVLPKVIFVSVDAKRDTPAQLARYVPYFDPDFLGVTARDQPTLQDLAEKLGVVVMLTAKPDGSYNVDHSSAIFVVDPAGKLAAILSGPFTVNALQGDFQQIVAARS